MRAAATSRPGRGRAGADVLALRDARQDLPQKVVRGEYLGEPYATMHRHSSDALQGVEPLFGLSGRWPTRPAPLPPCPTVAGRSVHALATRETRAASTASEAAPSSSAACPT